MKIFLSWSGLRSKHVAESLKEWLQCVLQTSVPWVSTQDVDRGVVWFSSIAAQLQETAVGIICLTQENKEKPWILFEAGALAKGLSSARVCTLLIDLEPSQVAGPLSHFNHTFPTKESIKSLVSTLNSFMGAGALQPNVLDRIFETYWPQLERELGDAIAATVNAPAPAKRDADDILGEILETTRGLSQRLRAVEGDRPNRILNTTRDKNGVVRKTIQLDDPSTAYEPVSPVVMNMLSMAVSMGADAEMVTQAICSPNPVSALKTLIVSLTASKQNKE